MHITPSERSILDAAVAIVVGDGPDALGYGRLAQRLDVTPDDIAEVYPVFEHLLAALLTRETGDLGRIVVENVDRDPRGGLPSRIFGYALTAVYEHPLARALYLGDPAGLSRIMRAVDGVTVVPDLTIHPELLPALQQVGMVRPDVDVHAVAAVISVLGSGVAMSAPGQHLDAVTAGLVSMLERAVDAQVVDTTPGKLVLAQYAATLAVGVPRG
jgi:AcrR family transcriptional regulator